MAVACAGFAGWLLVRARHRPEGVRVLRRTLAHPRLYAGAYFCFAAAFGARAAQEFFDLRGIFGLISLIATVGAVVLLVIVSSRRVSSSG